jgi:hypothetical protein
MGDLSTKVFSTVTGMLSACMKKYFFDKMYVSEKTYLVTSSPITEFLYLKD